MVFGNAVSLESCMQDTFARVRTRPSARATIGYLVYKLESHMVPLGFGARRSCSYLPLCEIGGL